MPTCKLLGSIANPVTSPGRPERFHACKMLLQTRVVASRHASQLCLDNNTTRMTLSYQCSNRDQAIVHPKNEGSKPWRSLTAKEHCGRVCKDRSWIVIRTFIKG